jgi:hypothetical protein
MMEAVDSSETLLSIKQTTQQHIPKDRTHQMRAYFQKEQESSLLDWVCPICFLTSCLKLSNQHEVYGRIDKDHGFVSLRTLPRVRCECKLSWNYISQGEPASIDPPAISHARLSSPLISQFNPYHAMLNHVVDQSTTITCAYIINKCKYILAVQSMQRDMQYSEETLCKFVS